MLNRYAMTTVALPTKNSPSNQVVPSRQVNTAHALAQYLENKQNNTFSYHLFESLQTIRDYNKS